MNLVVPEHVAIMMDGNGRWGKNRGLTRSEGHYAGVKAMEKVIDACIDYQIKALTLYAFSTENWSRPKDEVSYLMFLPIKFFHQKLPEFMKRNIKIVVSGNLNKVPKSTRNAITKAINLTKNNSGLVVNFAFNYGGRDDIVQAIRQVALEAKEKKIDIDQLDEQLFRQFLYTKDLPDPDLLIRTGGEKRISNFLLWQLSAAELYFTDVFFPDFNKQNFEEAIVEWQRRTMVVEYLGESM